MAATSTDILLRMCLDDRCCFEALDLINETSQSSANMTTRYIDKLEYDMRAEDTAWTVFAILCIASGFVLNALTIIVFVKGKRVPKWIKLLLINLAVADMCYSVVLPIKIMDYRLDRSLITTIMPCRIINYLYYVVLTVGPFCNLAVSLERLVIVYLPLKPLSAKAKSIIAVGVWVLALTSELGILVNTEMVHITDGDVYCSAVRSAYQQDECTLNTYVFMKILNILPIVLTISCYVLLAVKVSRRQQIGETRNPSSRQVRYNACMHTVLSLQVNDHNQYSVCGKQKNSAKIKKSYNDLNESFPKYKIGGL